MRDVYVIGVGLTAFDRHPQRSHADLAAEAVAAALVDADLAATDVESVVFGSCALHAWGQDNIRGQVVLRELAARSGARLLPDRAPITNVEAGCATGVLAFATAAAQISAGADVAMAVGVDKTWLADPSKIGALFEGAIDRLDAAGAMEFYRDQADEVGDSFHPEGWRSVLLDIAALVARDHKRRYGSQPEHLATIAAKNHTHAVHNPNAQVRLAMTPQQVLADKRIVDPFTRAMCAPIGDGAAAAIVASREYVERRGLAGVAVRYRGAGFAGGARTPLGSPNEATFAAERAWRVAGVGPGDVDVAEVHDASAFAELAATEALGFASVGEGGALVMSGATTLGGRLPINPSGGLESRGHPLAASGLAMVHEIVQQLRGRAGKRQVEGAKIGLVHNAGGLVGFDEALCGVAVLESPGALA